MNRRAGLKTLLSLLIIALALGGCLPAGQGNTPASSPVNTIGTSVQGETQAGATLALTPPPELPVKVISQAAVSDLQGNVHILGEVHNESGAAVQAVSLTVVAFDAAGTSLLRDESGATLAEAAFAPLIAQIGNAQAAPFDYTLPAGSPAPSAFQVFVTEYQPSEVQLQTLHVENSQWMVDADGVAALVGELVNPNPVAINVAGLAGVMTDPQGALHSASADWLGAGGLQPAGDPNQLDRAPFKIRFDSALQTDSAWQVFVDAEPAGELNSTRFAIDQAASYYEDSRGGGHLVSSIKNPAEQPFSVQILAGLYAGTGVVMDVSLLQLPIDLQPGQEIPFDVHGFPLLDGHTDLQSRLASYTLQVDPSRTTVSSRVWQILTPEGANQVQGEGGVWTFSGSVMDNLGTNFTRIVVMGILEDHSTGKVVAVSTANLTNPAGAIIPGMRMDYSFEVLADPNGTDPLDASVRVYALVD